MFPSLYRINPRLHAFSGEDINIIRKLNHPKINRNFNIIGFLVAVICVACLCSSGIFIYNVLEGAGRLFSIPIGLFWGFTVTNIYILLLYTISPPLLVDKSMGKDIAKRHKGENLRRFWDWLTFSMFLRLGFIFIFAVIVAQPLNVLFFGNKVKNDLDLYKMEFKSDMILTSDSTRIADEQKLFQEFHSNVRLANPSTADSILLAEKASAIDQKSQEDAEYLKAALVAKNTLSRISSKSDPVSENQKVAVVENFNRLTESQIESDRQYLENNENYAFANPDIQRYFADYSGNLRKIIQEKNDINEKTAEILDKNNFYLRQILLVNNRTKGALWLNILSCAVFLVPVFLKFRVRRIRIKDAGSFYVFKEQYEKFVVTEAYKKFKIRFKNTLDTHYQSHSGRAAKRLQNDLARLRPINPEKAAQIEREIAERYAYEAEFYEKYADPPFNLEEFYSSVHERPASDFFDDILKSYKS